MKLVENRIAMLDCAADMSEAGMAGCNDVPFFIKRDGAWLYKGRQVKRKSMICLFSSMLTRDATGRYLLDSPLEQGRIDIEDVPFVALEMRWRGEGKSQEICFRTNIDECIVAGRDHPLRLVRSVARPESVIYLHVRDGKGRLPLEARINRATYCELLALAEPGVIEGREVLGVWSGGVFFALEETFDGAMLPA